MICARNLAALTATLLLATAPSSASAFMPEFSAGLKLCGGANLWTEPTDAPGTGLGFRGETAGYGIGGGAYAEVRPIRFIGLELGLFYEQNKLWRNVDISGGIITVKEEVSANVLRVPVLVKAILPLGIVRLTAGIGPEFVLPQSTDGSHDVDSPSNIIGSVQTTIQTESKSSTMLAMDLGVVIQIGDFLEIPVSLRGARNLSQDEAWADRVNASISGNTMTSYSVAVQNSWDFRLTAGVGYVF